jgi:hypothetical protein
MTACRLGSEVGTITAHSSHPSLVSIDFQTRPRIAFSDLDPFFKTLTLSSVSDPDVISQVLFEFQTKEKKMKLKLEYEKYE